MEQKMTLFFNKLSKKTDEEEKLHYFYTPIVEQIKESDYQKERSFSFAEQKNVRRKFYCSANLLQQSEAGRLSADKFLSCYKIVLTESEKQQLEASAKEGLFTGFLHFSGSEVESLIVFKNGIELEQKNPLYKEEPAPSQTASFA
jgi:hypothetical protein